MDAVYRDELLYLQESAPIHMKNGRPCSKSSVEPAYVKFVNNTRCKVRIYWLDYDGNKVLYNKVGPGEFLEVNTYETHLWVFIDDITGDRLMGAGSYVYSPVPFRLSKEMVGSIPLALRRVVPIRYPLLTLKKRALQVIRDSISEAADIEELELPKSLKNDLLVSLIIKHRTLRYNIKVVSLLDVMQKGINN